MFMHYQIDGVGGDGKVGKGEIIYSDEEDEGEDADGEDAAEKERLSKKKQRKLAVRYAVSLCCGGCPLVIVLTSRSLNFLSQRLTVADLKTLVSHPEVIEWTDPTARDPRLLVELKSYRK